MKMKPALATTLLLILTCAASHSLPLDALIDRERANRDNEAVDVYAGHVGKLDAVFLLEWDEVNKLVSGYYYYPARSRTRAYRLEGTNPRPGVLLLREYTPAEGGGDRLSAHCRLLKRVTGDRIVWEGQMRNTDGRVLKMTFSRPK